MPHPSDRPVPPPPPNPRIPRRLLFVLLPLVVVAGGYLAWWLTATAELRDRALAWIDARRADGWVIDYAEVTRAGFPTELAVQFLRPKAHAPSDGPTWAGEHLRLSLPVLAADALSVSATGEQSLAWDSGGERRQWTGRAEVLRARLPLATPALDGARLEVRGLRAHGGSGGEETLEVARLEAVSRGDPAASTGPDVSTYGVELSADSIRLPPQASSPLGREVTHAALQAKLFGPIEPRPWPQSLAAWRDAGGVVEIERLVLAAGPVTVDGDGTIALDKAGQPIAAFALRIQGHDTLLDRMAGERLIPAHTAAAAKILLRALARPGADQRPTLVAPLSLQDRTLALGPVPLLKVPAVDWLGAAEPAGRAR